MLEAKANGALVKAEPKSPDVAQCPVCEGEVRKRRRKVGRNGHTYFYRHRFQCGASNDDCPLRYKPTS